MPKNPKPIELADEPEVAPVVESVEPIPVEPDPFSFAPVQNLLNELRRMGPRRAANHSLEVSSDLVNALRKVNPNLKPDGESMLFGVPFVVNGNLGGVSYRLSKKEKSAPNA